MRTPRLVFPVFSVLAASFGLSCGGGARQEDEVLVAALFDLTGLTADVGVDYADGVREHIQWVNEGGGIRGRPVRLLYQDFGYDVPRAEQLYSEFVLQEPVVFMGWGTGDTEALRLRIAEDQLPFSSASLSHVLGDAEESPYNFLVSTSYSDQFRIVLRWILDEHTRSGEVDPPRVALMHSASAFGRSPWIQGGEAYADEIGVQVTPYEMSAGATDYTATLSRVRQAGSEYVVFQNTSGPAAVALRNAHSMGMEATFVCLNWCANALLIRLAGEAAEGVVGAIPYAPLTDDVPGVRQLRDFREATGQGWEELTSAYTQGWWTMAVFAEGIGRVIDAGEPLTGENVKRALETFRDFDTGGAGPPITFTENDHRGAKALRLFRLENREWLPVTDLLSAPPWQ